MTERVLVGHFLTRTQAAQQAHTGLLEVQLRPDLLRLRGLWLEETYLEFQFDERGALREIGDVVQSLKERHTDIVIADWLARSHPLLGSMSPLAWLRSGRPREAVLDAAASSGPIDDSNGS
jgi:hypothetical protein